MNEREKAELQKEFYETVEKIKARLGAVIILSWMSMFSMLLVSFLAVEFNRFEFAYIVVLIAILAIISTAIVSKATPNIDKPE